MPRLFLIELFAGTRSVSKAVRRSSIGRAFDDFRLLSVDVDPKFQPTVCADINRWDCKSALDTFLADRTRSDVVVVHASPPCTEFSIALTTRPRNLRAGSKNVKTALQIIDCAAPSFWIIENPATGHLKDLPFMRKLERYKNTTCYCKWGFRYRKPTNIWTNLEDLQLPMCSSKTPCPQRRAHGRHLCTAQSGHSPDGFSIGSGRAELVYGLPPKLVRHLFRAGLSSVSR